MRTFLEKLWDRLVRFRTWVVNVLFGILITPDLVMVLLGFDWSMVTPPKYMPYVTLAIIVLNVWMRPRPAVRARDVEAIQSRSRKK